MNIKDQNTISTIFSKLIFQLSFKSDVNESLLDKFCSVLRTTLKLFLDDDGVFQLWVGHRSGTSIGILYRINRVLKFMTGYFPFWYLFRHNYFRHNFFKFLLPGRL